MDDKSLADTWKQGYKDGTVKKRKPRSIIVRKR